ncbi:leucine-rich repeat receptor protein kinase EXS-like protein [Corchorus olitorius]|uniref:Leucine-rich repeat receptor protein kinase EXS-like protein n=1 Tax=Corchorus olitorius TaxID=93759 RepID=A0A1R3L1C1_9ROSI|nr:leucine-rich repeat receptor protein kinase EXS-like protein [Corchorus olitorius]
MNLSEEVGGRATGLVKKQKQASTTNQKEGSAIAFGTGLQRNLRTKHISQSLERLWKWYYSKHLSFELSFTSSWDLQKDCVHNPLFPLFLSHLVLIVSPCVEV